MAIKIEYDRTEIDRDRIIAEQSALGNVLIEDQLHFDGAWLIFVPADEVPEHKPTVEDRIKALEDTVKTLTVATK